MRERVSDRSKPTVYLDNSTLCDAFRAFSLGGPAPGRVTYGPLFHWIERVATEANLCLSVFHLAELARWGDIAGARAMAEWYEHLPIVWVRPVADVEEAEDEQWTTIAAGLPSPAAVDPFARSLLSAFRELEPVARTMIMTSRSPLVALLDAARQSAHTEASSFFAEQATRFRADRAWAQSEGWSDSEKAGDLALKRRAELRVRSSEAHRRLLAQGGVQYADAPVKPPALYDRFIEAYESEPRAMPSHRARAAFNEGFIADALNRPGASKSEKKALTGSFHDLIHVAVGAAYCDVFTCDAVVDRWLGGLRTQLGLRRQLSVKTAGGPDAFVEALMEAWP